MQPSGNFAGHSSVPSPSRSVPRHLFYSRPISRTERTQSRSAPLPGGGERGLAARLLRETHFAAWPWLAGREDLWNIGILYQLSDEAAARSHQMPVQALAIARLAVDISGRITGKYPAPVVAQLRARAAKELGIVCRYMGRHQAALRAYDEAEQILAPHEALAHDRGVIQLARASTLQELGRFDESAADIARCKPVLDRYGDRRRLLICSVVEGTLLHRQAAIASGGHLSAAPRAGPPDWRPRHAGEPP